VYSALFIHVTPARSEGRYALVIGNSAYRGLPVLKNPVNDARLMARVLQTSLGYQVVGGENLDRASMDQRLKQFSSWVRSSGPNAFAVVFYAGHGMEVADENYLFPIDAIEPFTRDNISTLAISLTSIIKELESAGTRISVVILDACRDDGTRSTGRGFRTVGTPLGSIVVYSTAPGRVARDGDGQNSVFTQILSELIQAPGVSAEEVLFKVQDKVYRNTQPPQIPWVKPNLNGIAFSFNPVSEHPTPPRPVAAVPRQRLCETPRGAYGVVNVDSWDHLNLRGTPEVPAHDGHTTSNVTFKLPANATGIEIVPGSCTSGWCRVRYRCMEGWVSERHLALSSGAAPVVAPFQALGEFKVSVPAGELLSVREDPHHLAPLVAELAADDTGVLVHYCVVPKGNKETWCFLSHGNRDGWANARYLLNQSTHAPPKATR
jgi:uncharacterized protein YraI